MVLSLVPDGSGVELLSDCELEAWEDSDPLLPELSELPLLPEFSELPLLPELSELPLLSELSELPPELSP